MCLCVQTFKLTDRLFVGLSGLASDIQTLEQLLRFRLNLYKLREEREIKAETFSALLSHMLYEKRWGAWQSCMRHRRAPLSGQHPLTPDW